MTAFLTESWRRVCEAITMLATGETEQLNEWVTLYMDADQQHTDYVNKVRKELVDLIGEKEQLQAQLTSARSQLSQHQKDAQERQQAHNLRVSMLSNNLNDANSLANVRSHRIAELEHFLADETARANRNAAELNDCKSREADWTDKLTVAKELVDHKDKVIRSQLIELERWVEAHKKVSAALKEMRGNVVADPPKQTLYINGEPIETDIMTATINGIVHQAPKEGYP